jgi:type IV pilus assembly protein PilA
MVKYRRSRLLEHDGMSLLELIIVAAIIGVLAAAALPAFGSYRDRAQTAALFATGASVRSALAVLGAEAPQSLFPASLTVAHLAAYGAPLPAGDYRLTYTPTGTPLGTSYTLLLERSVTGYQVCITPAHTKKTTAGMCS